MNVSKCCGTLCSAIALAALSPAAHAETRTTLDVSAGARAATNPYLIAGSSNGAVAATIEASPSIETGNGVSTLRIDGSARYDRYLRRYGDDLSGRAGVTFDQRFSERTRFTLAGLFATSMGGARDLLRTNIGSGTDFTPTIDPTADVTVTGARFRQYNYGANARLNSRLSSRGSLSLGGGVNVFDTSAGIGQPYSQYVSDVGYNHIVDDRKQIGLQVGYSNINYRNRAAGDGDVITPAITGTFKLNSTFSISGRVGAAFSAIRQLNGARARTTSVAAQVSMCKEMVRSTFCLSGNRDVQATSLGGVSTVSTVSLSYNMRLGERDTLDFVGNYGLTDQPAASAVQFGANRTKLASASAVYSRRLSE